MVTLVRRLMWSMCLLRRFVGNRHYIFLAEQALLTILLVQTAWAEKPTRLQPAAARIVYLDLPQLPADIDPRRLQDGMRAAISKFAAPNPIAPLSGGYNDPNAIVYDEARFWRQIFASNPSVIACGFVHFTVETSNGVKRDWQYFGAVDDGKFGRTFHADRLIQFLDDRPGHERTETQFRLRHLNKLPEGKQLRLPKLTPWEEDLCLVILLLRRSKIEEVVPSFIRLLDDPCEEIRNHCFWALSELGGDSEEAVARMHELMQSDDQPTAIQARRTLSWMQPESVPILLLELQDELPKRRQRGARLLGEIGARAKEAMPSLEKMLADPDLDCRRDAQKALHQIRADEK